jgi:hypothetical protein
MRTTPIACALVFALAASAAEHNVIIYKQPERFAGWPANHGIWSWGDEIVVGFEAGSDNDNPPGMAHLRNGRLAIAYGRRTAPFGIRARLSADEGKTRSSEIVLRDDGGCWDLGYTRSVQRRDGKIVTSII